MVWLGSAAAQTGKQAQKQPAKKAVASTAKKGGAPAAKKSATVANRSAPVTRKGATTARKRTTSPGAHTASTKGKKPARRPSVTWRNRQTMPSAERYREIQNALVSRGYLAAEEATGVWNQASVDALRRFQAEQNIDSSGKINSLSLIALGLGPKRENAPVAPPKPQVEPGPGE